MRKAVGWMIKWMHKLIFYNKLPTCRFSPSCSVYALESIEKRGVISGLTRTLIRLLRCHPFSKGGYDPA